MKLEDRLLTVEGTRTTESDNGNQKESRYFQRKLTVPESVNLDTLKAKFESSGKLIIQGETIGDAKSISGKKCKEIELEEFPNRQHEDHGSQNPQYT